MLQFCLPYAGQLSIRDDHIYILQIGDDIVGGIGEFSVVCN